MSYGTTLRSILGAGGVGRLFNITSFAGTGVAQNINTGQQLSDGGLVWGKMTDGSDSWGVSDTLRGDDFVLTLESDAINDHVTDSITFTNSGATVQNSAAYNNSSFNYVMFSWLKKAGYLDIQTYLGNGTPAAPPTDVPHDLGVAPSFIIIKPLNVTGNWSAFHTSLGLSSNRIIINDSAGAESFDAFASSGSTNVSVNSRKNDVSEGVGTQQYIMYLFAEKAGASKFGTYSGTTTINTGLSGISSFLVKRTDHNGDWYLFYKDGGTWYHVHPNSIASRATGLISVTGGDVTLSGSASNGTGIYMASK